MIVRITEQVGRQQLVARAHVQVGHPQIRLQVLQPRYDTLLQRVFSAPIVEFVAGFSTPQLSGDAAVTYPVGAPEWLLRLPNELVGAGLRVHLSATGWVTLLVHLRVLEPMRRWGRYRG
jgi:hypothetical protein